MKSTIAFVCMIVPTEASQSSPEANQSQTHFKVVIKNDFNVSGFVYQVADPENTLLIEKVKSGSTWIFDTYTQTKWGLVSGNCEYFTQFVVGQAPVNTRNKTLPASQFEWLPIEQIPFKFQQSICSNTEASQSSTIFKVVIKNDFNISGRVYRVVDLENIFSIKIVNSGSTWTINTYTQTKWSIVSGDLKYFTQFLVGQAPVDKSDKTLLASQFEWLPINQIPFKFQQSICSGSDKNDASGATVDK